MRSYQIARYGEALRRADREPPAPHGTEVLVRVLACGVCHTDVHLRDGYHDLGGGNKLDLSRLHRLPLTPGHEIAGEVAATGPEASGVAAGDRRVVFPWIGCGACDVCLAGRENLCHSPTFLGTHIDGGYSDYVVVPHPRYLLDHSDIPEHLACTYACSGVTAYSALKKVAPLDERDTLVIVGAGGVGQMGIRLARVMLKAELVVADIDHGKLVSARDAGVAHTVDPNDESAVARVRKISNGGAAAVVDFVGAPSPTEFGMKVLRRGARLVVVGLFGGALSISLPLLPLRMMTLMGSLVGTLSEMEELMVLARAGDIAPVPIETRGLERANESLDDLVAGRVAGRTVLVP